MLIEEKKVDGNLFQNKVKKFGFSNIRLKDPKLFSLCIKKGKKLFSDNFMFYCLDYNIEKFKIGIITARDIRPSTFRNRIKRLIREFFRLNKDKIKDNMLFVVKPKTNCNVENYKEVEKELNDFFIKERLFKNN